MSHALELAETRDCDLFCVHNISRARDVATRCKFSKCHDCSFYEEASNGTTVDVAINVFESPDVIQRQWANVFEMMRGLSPRIVLSCNAAMSRELQTPHWRPPPGLVSVNPEVIDRLVSRARSSKESYRIYDSSSTQSAR